jgi:hypothetical protein
MKSITISVLIGVALGCDVPEPETFAVKVSIENHAAMCQEGHSPLVLGEYEDGTRYSVGCVSDDTGLVNGYVYIYAPSDHVITLLCYYDDVLQWSVSTDYLQDHPDFPTACNPG